MNGLNAPPDLFEAENRALLAGRYAYETCSDMAPGPCHLALGELLKAYERLLRETRRLVRHSDRAELELTQLNQRLQDLASQLEYRATHDSLTGIFNRAAIIGLVNRHFLTQDLSLVLLDIDHFKRVNDSFGHPVGDRVIVGVVDCLKGVVPSSAYIGRVGGEEFTVLLPGQSGDEAEQLAQAARRGLEAHDFDLPDGSGITASFGVSWAPCGGKFDDTYNQADQALYQAKRNGRNQVARFSGQPQSDT